MTRRMTTSSKVDVTYHETEAGDYTGFSLVLRIPPVPASRPRVTRWGVYYTKTYQAYRDAAHEAIPMCERTQLSGDLGATIEFVCHKPKRTVRERPNGDIDNHMKAILDAVVGTKDNPKLFIEDDMQITHVDATKRWAEPDEEPHTAITIGHI